MILIIIPELGTTASPVVAGTADVAFTVKYDWKACQNDKPASVVFFRCVVWAVVLETSISGVFPAIIIALGDQSKSSDTAYQTESRGT